MNLAILAAFATALAACGPTSPARGDGGPRADAAVPYLRVAPAAATVSVVDGVAQTQAYTATLVALDGGETDVTAQTTFALADPVFGTFTGAITTLDGGGAGVTMVSATTGTATGTAQLTVTVKGSRVEGGAPANAGTMFGTATENAAIAPAIVYPADGILAPPNLGAFDVHWTSSADNLFAVECSNAYVDLTVYTTGLAGGSWWTALQPAEWAELATTRTPIAVTVAGLATSAPATKGTSAPIHVHATNEPMIGGVYYWTTTTQTGASGGNVFRYDMTKPLIPPAPYYTNNVPGGYCIGCHALSHDGTKMAFAVGSVPGPGAVVNVADQSVLLPYATNPTDWQFATFNADGTKLITVETGGGLEGTMVLRQSVGGAVLATIPNSPGAFGDHPDVSADGTMLANVESTQANDLEPSTGALVVRPFDDTSNAFGTIQTVIADGVDQLSSYYPSWSPDGKWLLTTRVGGPDAYANPASTVWVVKADGTQPPIKLANANANGMLENSWARWAPFAQTVGTSSDPLYFITFTSIRPFGVRIPTIGTPQIWMASFDPALASAGMDPSGPAFRPPFQDVTTHNHIAQWTQQVVVIE